MQGSIFRWLYQHRLSIGATTAVMILLISSIVVIPRGLSIYAQSSQSGSHSQYIPSNAFGDTDDLPNGTIKAKRVGLAPGASSVSGVVTDASTGSPVANAQVAISPGAVGATAQYTTTGSDGSFSFSGIASGTYNLSASRYSLSGTQPFYKDAQQMGVNASTGATVNFSLTSIYNKSPAAGDYCQDGDKPRPYYTWVNRLPKAVYSPRPAA